MSDKIKILDEEEVKQKIKRLSWQIYESNIREKDIIFVGIADRGLILAKRLAKNIEDISDLNTRISHIKIDKKNPYKDIIDVDISSSEYTNKVVILCDDVINSGKTLIYASKHFLSVPLKKLSTVALVDRNHNRYPIKSDYVGLSLATTLQEYISVVLDGSDQGVYLS